MFVVKRLRPLRHLRFHTSWHQHRQLQKLAEAGEGQKLRDMAEGKAVLHTVSNPFKR